MIFYVSFMNVQHHVVIINSFLLNILIDIFNRKSMNNTHYPLSKIRNLENCNEYALKFENILWLLFSWFCHITLEKIFILVDVRFYIIWYTETCHVYNHFRISMFFFIFMKNNQILFKKWQQRRALNHRLSSIRAFVCLRPFIPQLKIMFIISHPLEDDWINQ